MPKRGTAREQALLYLTGGGVQVEIVCMENWPRETPSTEPIHETARIGGPALDLPALGCQLRWVISPVHGSPKMYP